MLRALSAIFLMSQYVFNPQPLDWDAAELHCSQSDSQLLVPATGPEVEVVQRLMLTLNVTAIHVGVHDKFLEGRYVTLHGEDIGQAVSRHWARGAPHGGMSRNCVALTTSGLVDVECRQPLNSLCQRRRWSDYVRLAPHGRYRLVSNPASWTDAWASCQADHAHLVVLNGDDELRTLLRAFPGEDARWVGAHALHDERAGFVTVHGESLASAGFVRWDGPVPRADDLRSRPYAALHGLRGLRPHGSLTRLQAICERPL